MITIRIWADTYSTGLINEMGASIQKDETPISEGLWSNIQAWVESYDDIIPMGRIQRLANKDRIEDLDRQGIQLFEKVVDEWSRNNNRTEKMCFKYYSEGKLKYLKECFLD